MPVNHNLPDQPYKKFFGRSESINNIRNTLLEGGTFIASIDGVGGIGKTALAYYFCKEILIPEEKFDYIVWVTSKKTVFDPFSKDTMIKMIDNDFYGIESLIDATLHVIEYEDFIVEDFAVKKEFFENEIINNERIFFVLDNLENIDNNDFFNYITKDFNRLSGINRNFKVLTTSRKRKRIIDFPIDIEGLTIEDALSMLKYLAKEFNLNAVLNASDFNNVRLLEKVGNIPLGIEFIVGQMALGRNLGQIYRELNGYPNLEQVLDEEEKKKRLSEIILFSFKDMYETLDHDHQRVFKTIAALQKNKKRNDEISFELIMTITEYSKYELDKLLENLTDNKLITLNKDEYSISQMAINFVRQYYEAFEPFENEIIGIKEKIAGAVHATRDKVDVYLENVKIKLEENKYEEAEEFLLRTLDVYSDARLYYELAKIQRVLNKFAKAGDNFHLATQFAPQSVKIWYDWINMEDVRQRHNIALHRAEQALERTDNDVSIVIQMINIHKFRRNYAHLRNEVEKYLRLYESEKRDEAYLKLLRHWKSIEYSLVGEGTKDNYIKVAELLIEKEKDIEVKLQLSSELLKIVKKKGFNHKLSQIQNKMQHIKERIKESVGSRTKQLNRLFNAHEYDQVKKEARKILRWFDEDNYDEREMPHYQNVLRVLMQSLAREHDYEKQISIFEEWAVIGNRDDNCLRMYERAQKMKIEDEKNTLIGEISVNIQSAEVNLRNILMWSFDFDESTLINAILAKGRNEWIAQWKTTKNKSMKKDADLIHYSDLSHLCAILLWQRNEILKRINTPKLKHTTQENLTKIITHLQDYVTPERNETFHSRLQLFEFDELNHILTDSKRLLNLTNLVKVDLRIEK
jgi:tetratricopeptide (TPR) repeat protein